MRGLLGPDESRTRTKTRALSRVTVQERPIPTRGTLLYVGTITVLARGQHSFLLPWYKGAAERYPAGIEASPTERA